MYQLFPCLATNCVVNDEYELKLIEVLTRSTTQKFESYVGEIRSHLNKRVSELLES